MRYGKLKASLALVLSISFSACSTFPSSGPTGPQLRKDIAASKGSAAIRIVEVGGADALPPAEPDAPVALQTLPPPPTDMVGPGDVLDIAVYEAGVTLFGRNTAATGEGGAGFDPTAKVQTLPPTRVDDHGDIAFPYLGVLHVAGKTVGEIRNQIRGGLRGLSQNPQVLVALRETIGNSVILGGEVARPGRLVLPTNRETLSDAIALAGGYRGNAKDLLLRVTRQDRTIDLRLSAVMDKPALDVRVYPGDRLTLLSDPRTYSVLGSSGRVDQLPFTLSSVTLAQAIAAVGGVNPNTGDPAAVFLFRYVADTQGHEEPVVYHLDMMKAGSYFLAGRFALRDKDILYFGSARSNQASKLAQFVSQLFSPVLTVVSGVQAARYSGN